MATIAELIDAVRKATPDELKEFQRASNPLFLREDEQKKLDTIWQQWKEGISISEQFLNQRREKIESGELPAPSPQEVIDEFARSLTGK